MFYRWLFLSLFLTMWIGWFALWRAMAFRVKAAAESESVPSRLSHLVPLLFAGYLLAAPQVPIPLFNERFVPLAIWPAALGAALTFVGLFFCVWARSRLRTIGATSSSSSRTMSSLSTVPIDGSGIRSIPACS